MSYRIRYIAGAFDGKFASITYPARNRPAYASREHAEKVLAAMPVPSRMEIVEGE